MSLARRISVMMSIFLLSLSCGERNSKVIPRDKLAEIYAEMLMTDQWISGTPDLRRKADTSLVYEPILESYGYSTDDYMKTVEVYMDDPERFSRILRTTVAVFDKKLKGLEKRKAEIEKMEALEKMRESMKIEIEVDIDELNPYMFKEPYVHYYDSLAVEADSSGIYRFGNIDRGDTIYRNLRMIILDTLQTKDTLMVADTMEAK